MFKTYLFETTISTNFNCRARLLYLLQKVNLLFMFRVLAPEDLPLAGTVRKMKVAEYSFRSCSKPHLSMTNPTLLLHKFNSSARFMLLRNELCNF
jgi:hypothetical protein